MIGRTRTLDGCHSQRFRTQSIFSRCEALRSSLFVRLEIAMKSDPMMTRARTRNGLQLDGYVLIQLNSSGLEYGYKKAQPQKEPHCSAALAEQCYVDDLDRF